MATERQIEANRRNASRSSGPKTAEGRARSRLNAVKHGMAGESAEVEAMVSAEFAARRAKWGAEFAPVGEAGEWAMDRAVAASLRIERCERAVDEIQSASSERAELAWDQDRAVEAATVFNRLSRDPVLASRQLQTTFAGVLLLIDAWLGLAASVQDGGDWSESEVSRALDLLGVSPDSRSGRTPVDDPDGGDPAAFRWSLAFGEIDRLQALRDEVLEPLEDGEQRRAIRGDVALLSKPARLVMRYEREAWRRYRESIAQVRESAKAEVPGPVAEVPVAPVEVPPVKKAEPRRAVEPAPERSFEEERQELLAMAAPILEMFGGRLEGLDLGDEPEWLLEMERRLDAEDSAASAFRVGVRGRPPGNPGASSLTERTQLPGGRPAPAPVAG